MPDITIFNPRKKPVGKDCDTTVAVIVAAFLSGVAVAIFLLIHLAEV